MFFTAVHCELGVYFEIAACGIHSKLKISSSGYRFFFFFCSLDNTISFIIFRSFSIGLCLSRSSLDSTEKNRLEIIETSPKVRDVRCIILHFQVRQIYLIGLNSRRPKPSVFIKSLSGPQRPRKLTVDTCVSSSNICIPDFSQTSWDPVKDKIPSVEIKTFRCGEEC